MTDIFETIQFFHKKSWKKISNPNFLISQFSRIKSIKIKFIERKKFTEKNGNSK